MQAYSKHKEKFKSSSLKALLSGMGRTPRGVVAIMVISLVSVALSLGFVWSSKRVVDIATRSLDGAMGRSVAIMAAVMLLQIVCTVSLNYIKGRTLVKNTNLSRSDFFEKTLRSKWSSQEKFHSADVANRLEQDIRETSEFVCDTLPEAIVTLIQLAASTIYLFVLAPQLGWILIWIMPVAVLTSRLFFFKVRRISKDIRTIEGRIQGHVQESLQHRIISKTIGSEDAVLGYLDNLQDDRMNKSNSRLAYFAYSRTFMQLGFTAGYLTAFLWGAFSLRNGTATYGLMVAFLQLVSQVQRPVAILAFCVPKLISSLASQERLMELRSLPQEEVCEEIFFTHTPGVRGSGIFFSYPDRDVKVLEDVSFDFAPGKFSVVCAPTGQGKSTLMQIILALLSPDEGKVEIYDDSEVSEVCAGTRCNFMYVPQGNTLLSGTIRDNLLVSKPEATPEELEAALRTAVAEFVFDLPEGLDTVCSEIGRALSEGQAQRIAIARALLHKGNIMILDEATSALDEETEALMLSRLKDFCAGKKTVICITHRPAALGCADSVLRL